jgi:hypothetical protein
MFDEYDHPQGPFQLVIKYVKNRYVKDLDDDIVKCIKAAVDTEDFRYGEIYKNLHYETGYSIQIREKIKTLVHTLDSMDSRHITNIGARIYIGNNTWIQVWRREPKYVAK